MAKKIEKTLDKQENPIAVIGSTDNSLALTGLDEINESIKRIGFAIAKDYGKSIYDDRTCVYFTFKHLGYNSYESAVMAGYSESYAVSGMLSKKTCPDHIRKGIDKRIDVNKDRYKRSATFLLPMIRQADIKVLEEGMRDPEFYVKAQSVRKSIESLAGVQSFDDSSSGNTINIGQIQAYISNNLKLDD